MSLEVLAPDFDLEQAVAKVTEVGYFYGENALTEQARHALHVEIHQVPLKVGDHITRPLNQGKPNEVRQQHARYYSEYGSKITPAANMVIDGLAIAVQNLKATSGLTQWKPNEVGYQLYRNTNDFIGAHRDRASDQLLSATFTISGESTVRVFEAIGGELDYAEIRQTDEFAALDGGVMLLRAPGLGSGEQIIHQVLPPSTDSRAIVNFRMRNTILTQPN